MASENEQFKVPSYPIVGAVQGKVHLVTGKSETPVPAKLKMLLRERALITTGDEEMIRLDLSPTDSIFVWPQTQFDLSVIDFEKGSVEKMFLSKGKIRLVQVSDIQRRLESPLHADSVGRGDFLFEMLPPIARLRVIVAQGSLSFRGLESERFEGLTEKQTAYFQGVLEDGEIGYDTLMHGKRIAKGKVGPITLLKDTEIKKEFGEVKVLEKTYVPPKALRPPPPDPNILCHEPNAHLGDCAWVCEGMKKGTKNCSSEAGHKCFRKRCSPQGTWVDPYELRKQEWKCEQKPVIGACDY